MAPWLPARLQAIISRAMARNPRGRYPTMTAFAEDLDGSWSPETATLTLT